MADYTPYGPTDEELDGKAVTKAKFGALQTIAAVMKALAYAIAAIGTAFVLYSAATNAPVISKLHTLPWLFSISMLEAIVITWSMFVLAASEWIRVFLAIEENTRKIAELAD